PHTPDPPSKSTNPAPAPPGSSRPVTRDVPRTPGRRKGQASLRSVACATPCSNPGTRVRSGDCPTEKTPHQPAHHPQGQRCIPGKRSVRYTHGTSRRATNSPCATKPPSPSPRSTNGSNL